MKQSPLITAALLGCAGMMFLFAVLFVRAMAFRPTAVPRPPVEAPDKGSDKTSERPDEVPTKGEGDAGVPHEGRAAPSKGGAVPDGADAGTDSNAKEAPGSGEQGSRPPEESDDEKPAEEGLVTTLKKQVVPSLLMCMQERVGRGESYKGEVSFKVKMKPDDGDGRMADVELVSVDGPDMKKADYDCIWPNFEDVSLKVEEGTEPFAGRDEINAEFGIVIDVLGAK